VAFSPNGKYVATASDDKTARLWNVASGQEVFQFIGHTNQVKSVAFSPNGLYLLTGSDDTTARLWNVSTGREVRSFVSHTAPVRSVAFTPDGLHVLTGSGDKTARIWDTDYIDTVLLACDHVFRDLTDEERTQYLITDTSPICP
jgi:WD40 repeat protein